MNACARTPCTGASVLATDGVAIDRGVMKLRGDGTRGSVHCKIKGTGTKVADFLVCTWT
jgi:hypothetical protein